MSEINITLKLYSGIEKELKIHDYNPESGIIVTIKKGTSLRKILRKTGFKKLSRYVFFCCGHNVSVWKRFYQQAEVSCLKISGGG
ncbi:MAG TPA: hypothetical protein PK514_10520 [Spirochaetota bacterium]|nr:hypothetical protein [Spirochaetota bacterium]